jgi:cell wall-associated NlpC family hydrolase
LICAVAALVAAPAVPLQQARAQAEAPAILRGALAPRVISADTAVLPALAGPSADAVVRSADDLPQPFADLSASARSLRDSLVAVARAQIGRRYRFGGGSPEHGFDCSGLVRYVMAALHIDLPRTAREQALAGVTVPRDTTQLRPGDLLMFGSPKHISHVGIYVGDGRFVQASSKAGRVVETPLIRPMVRGVKVWRAARRVMLADDSTTVAPDPSSAVVHDGAD